MRIIYHHRTLGDGAEGIHIREMVKAFRKLGHEVEMAGPVGEKVPEPGTNGGVLAKIKKRLPGFFFELMEIGYSFWCLWELSAKIRKARPDFIYDRYITFNFGALLAAKLHKVPYVLEINAPLAYERSNEPDEGIWFGKVAYLIEKTVATKADHTIVVSTPLKKYLESIGVPMGKSMVMPNGVDPKKFYPGPKNQKLLNCIGIAKKQIVIGFAGILRPWHGIEKLIKAASYLKEKGIDIFLLIVGDGPIRKDIENLILESNLQNCSYITGRVSHDKIPSYVNLFDIAVSPSSTFYASPMKVVEYMALGKVVLVPNRENFRDLIEPDQTGILFDEKDGSILKSLLTIFSSDGVPHHLGAQAAKRVEKRLNWEWNAREISRMILNDEKYGYSETLKTNGNKNYEKF